MITKYLTDMDINSLQKISNYLKKKYNHSYVVFQSIDRTKAIVLTAPRNTYEESVIGIAYDFGGVIRMNVYELADSGVTL